MAAKFAPSFSLKFLSISVHISGSIKPITLIWLSLERSFPPAEVDYRWCQFWSKVMTSEEEQRKRRLRPARESKGEGSDTGQSAWLQGQFCLPGFTIYRQVLPACVMKPPSHLCLAISYFWCHSNLWCNECCKLTMFGSLGEAKSSAIWATRMT